MPLIQMFFMVEMTKTYSVKIEKCNDGKICVSLADCNLANPLEESKLWLFRMEAGEPM